MDYTFWADADGHGHNIYDMDTTYINNCINQIAQVADTWKRVTYADLSSSELEQLNVPLRKAWFVVHGLNYLKSFKDELETRYEDISQVSKLIKKVEEAKEH